MEMTQKQIEIEAQNYLNGLDLPENADKQLILDNFKNGMSWMLMYAKEEKQKLIDRLEDWLANNICNAYNFRGDNISSTFINDCIKSTKGE